jgi:hypothetical protein
VILVSKQLATFTTEWKSLYVQIGSTYNGAKPFIEPAAVSAARRQVVDTFSVAVDSLSTSVLVTAERECLLTRRVTIRISIIIWLRTKDIGLVLRSS